MIESVEGIYRNGKIELLQEAPTQGESRVIVTFLSVEGGINLAARLISPEQAKDLRGRLKPFEDDWSRSDMDAYDAL